MTSSLSQTIFFSILLLLSLHQAYAKKTHLHFYFHETILGPNATVMTVVRAPNSTSDALAFGAIAVVDDILREGEDENSTLIGRCQGLVAEVGLDGSRETLQNFVFTDGKYNGSTLAVYGKHVSATKMETLIIGGTGLFRMTKGYTIGIPLLITDSKVIYEFDVYVWHMEMKDD
ncbi:Dirigent protein [Rhynchospora pubera]|uniref:Dirigent protein n=1 Tax=Rhynchospora pubera TaxID=906938 RepID=A0AAV8HH06_9POAL|nr:Dirigent protein [Rhynchospora pubera]